MRSYLNNPAEVYKEIPFTKIENLQFRIYTDEEIKQMAVLEVTSEKSISVLGHYYPNGIYDAKLGPSSYEDELCQTCKFNATRCGGHCGYINLPLPVCNPFLLQIMQFLLDGMCFICHRFQISGERALQFIFEMQMFHDGFVTSSLDVASRGANVSPEDIDVDDKRSKREVKESNIGYMQNALLQYYREVKKEKVNEGDTTSYSQSVYYKLLKSFIAHKAKMKKKCIFCKAIIPKIRMYYSRITIVNPMSDEKQKSEKLNRDIFHEPEIGAIDRSQEYVTPEQARNALRKCHKLDGPIIETIFPFLKQYKGTNIQSPTDVLFISNLLVIPPKFRPVLKRNNTITQHELSTVYEKILGFSHCLRYLVNFVNKDVEDIPKDIKVIVAAFRGSTIAEKTHSIWEQLQRTVDNIYDSDLSGFNKVSEKGVRQLIEKKFGLMRQNLMGKRVNFSARSVAAPDPMLAADEVGVPMEFAMALSYKVPVTSHNYEKMRTLIINGAKKYPGALKVEDEEGKMTSLLMLDDTQRTALANSLLTPVESCVKRRHPTKIVYRHLENGDFVLMNRQPTLHKPSIQAHKARIMKNERVLRLPYATCKAYNADFDGDELNLHFPQDELSRSEAKYIVTTKKQYLTPKDGTPLAGLIQDCVVASVMLTMRGTMFNREDYQQMVYMALQDVKGRITLMKPTILKPKCLWTGKQIISTIMLNLLAAKSEKLSFNFKTSVKSDLWQTQEPREWLGGGTPEKRKESMTESDFIMRQGELLCGVVDKCAIGSTSHGLVHTCYDLYGPTIATQLLTSINRLCVTYLQWFGHTIGIKEFVTPSSVAETRRNKLEKLVESAHIGVSKRLNIDPELLSEHIERVHMSNDARDMAAVDAAYTAVLGPTTSHITSENESGLYRSHLDNHMRMMVNTGAKGSKINMSQMASLFGSVAMDGKRMPLSATGKALPSSKPYDVDPRSGGYIATRFMTGIDPRSYFFLCVVGRDSLQHTAVKTAHSGYVQRCLMKHLEGIHVEYDMTVRNSDGTVLQFEYGEDGLDVTKTPFLSGPSTLDTLVDNKECVSGNDLGQEKHILKFKKKVKKFLKHHTHKSIRRKSGFLEFSKNYTPVTDGLKCSKAWDNLTPEDRSIYAENVTKYSEVMPISSVYSGSATLGVVSERIENLIEDYYKNYYRKRPLCEQRLDKEEISNIIYKKVMSCRVDPGEAVGALCAQAIGEPLTQMTLNTFHFAGRDELNVTLGVPRMVEILKTASANISTPIMEIPFLDGITSAQAEKLRKILTPVPLSKVIENVKLTTYIKKSKTTFRFAELVFKFLPHKEYKHIYCVNSSGVLNFFEKYFITKVFIGGIKNALKVTGTFCSSSSKEEEREMEQETELEKEIPKGLEEDVDDDLSETEETVEEDLDGLSTKISKESEVYEGSDTSDVEKLEEMEEEEEITYNIKEEEKSILEVKDEMIVEEPEEKIQFAPTISLKEYDERINTVLLQDRWIMDYSFDDAKQSWCKLSLALPIGNAHYDIAAILKVVVNRTNVHSVRGIKKALVVEDGSSLMLRTEGVNVPKMYSHANLLDLNRLYTNNISLTAEMYGIEAAQKSIIREIRNVQAAYDIKVDFRHLSLLSDYFTCEGVYKACSRHAIETCASPIQKMTYETGFAFLRKALVQGHADRMCSPSANVMVGQPIKFGTNSMDILTKLSLKSEEAKIKFK